MKSSRVVVENYLLIARESNLKIIAERCILYFRNGVGVLFIPFMFHIWKPNPI
jgi:hypothetical protein